MKKKCIYIFLLSFLSLRCQAQKIEKQTRQYLKHQLDSLNEQDQKYRWQIAFRELDQSVIDSLKKLPHEIMFNRINAANAGQIGFSDRIKDSLQNLQDIINASNYVVFVTIIKKYGYPSYERTRSYASTTLRLHFVNSNQFEELLPLYKYELERGNLTPEDFASWYDRCLILLRKKQIYGEFEKNFPCVLNLENTNLERAKIGLKPMKKNNCRN